MKRSDIVVSLAKTVAATAFGGPLAGAGTAASEAIDLIAGWLGGREKDIYAATIDRVGKDLERLVASEGMDPALLDQALAQAGMLVAERGATLDEMNSLGLEPGRVADAVLARGGPGIADLDEGAQELCRRVVTSLYSSLLADTAALPGLEAAFKRAVLARLDLLPELPDSVAAAVQSAAALAVVRNPARWWRPGLFAPSSLLRAEFAIVPFQGREQEIADLEAWCQDSRPLAVRLYTGAGGMGKTRLMIEMVSRLSRAGWRAGFVAADLPEDGAPLAWLMRDASALLLVVDYAETRRRDVRAIIGAALEAAHGTVVRIVLLARARADWWRDLLAQGGGVGDVLAGPATAVHALEPLVMGEAARDAAFRSAASSFASVLRHPAPPGAPEAGLSLDGRLFDRVLFIHLAALAAVEAERAEGEQGLLDFALRREQQFWDTGVRAAGLDFLAGRAIAQAAAVATLAGTAASRPEAVALISSAPLLAGQPATVTDAVAELLHRLYPSEQWLQGVQPDLLGEHLVGQAIEDDANLLEVFARA